MVEDQLGKEVNGYLKDKRYLIVLDDVQSIQVWHKSNKSRVLITTHNQQIASDAHAQLYELRPLCPEESWMPFLKKTFPTASTSPVVCLVEFEGMGNEIIKKCKGLPLAIVVSGGLLSRKEKSKSSWEKILKGMEWKSKSRPQLMLGNCCFELQ